MQVAARDKFQCGARPGAMWNLIQLLDVFIISVAWKWLARCRDSIL